MNTTDYNMIEELAASLTWAAEKATGALADVQEVDPGDLLIEMEHAPAIARQLTESLANLAALGREAAELLEMLP